MACRRHVEQHFTVDHLAEGYEIIYRKVLATSTATAFARPQLETPARSAAFDAQDNPSFTSSISKTAFDTRGSSP